MLFTCVDEIEIVIMNLQVFTTSFRAEPTEIEEFIRVANGMSRPDTLDVQCGGGMYAFRKFPV